MPELLGLLVLSYLVTLSYIWGGIGGIAILFILLLTLKPFVLELVNKGEKDE